MSTQTASFQDRMVKKTVALRAARPGDKAILARMSAAAAAAAAAADGASASYTRQVDPLARLAMRFGEREHAEVSVAVNDDSEPIFAAGLVAKNVLGGSDRPLTVAQFYSTALDSSARPDMLGSKENAKISEQMVTAVSSRLIARGADLVANTVPADRTMLLKQHLNAGYKIADRATYFDLPLRPLSSLLLNRVSSAATSSTAHPLSSRNRVQLSNVALAPMEPRDAEALLAARAPSMLLAGDSLSMLLAHPRCLGVYRAADNASRSEAALMVWDPRGIVDISDVRGPSSNNGREFLLLCNPVLSGPASTRLLISLVQQIRDEVAPALGVERVLLRLPSDEASVPHFSTLARNIREYLDIVLPLTEDGAVCAAKLSSAAASAVFYDPRDLANVSMVVKSGKPPVAKSVL